MGILTDLFENSRHSPNRGNQVTGEEKYESSCYNYDHICGYLKGKKEVTFEVTGGVTRPKSSLIHTQGAPRPIFRQRIVKQKVINPAAIIFLQEHKIQLHKNGWTAPELYRRNRSKGIAWIRLWEKEDLVVKINKLGHIVFTFENAGGAVIQQTALPVASWK